ncbi:hypothetical protein SISNIDRAFT_547485 [Sistotremastrum niveocremeum HHB9708]|uniref:Uncharacterized protein n=1 Tax=Sistotremastrum niveocremeum HHB9708 TaxID=1314777 RepID=A0A164YAI1_9AGAM|nr:hypothetical protein SISNIDRAFT_547485 [Sistotremastrum niveocremeum HHB9708]
MPLLPRSFARSLNRLRRPIYLDAEDTAPDSNVVDALRNMYTQLKSAEATFEGWIAEIEQSSGKDQQVTAVQDAVNVLHNDVSQAIHAATTLAQDHCSYAGLMTQMLITASRSSSRKLSFDKSTIFQRLSGSIVEQSNALEVQIAQMKERIALLQRDVNNLALERRSKPSTQQKVATWLESALKLCAMVAEAVAFALPMLAPQFGSHATTFTSIAASAAVASAATSAWVEQEKIHHRLSHPAFFTRIPVDAEQLYTQLSAFPAYQLIFQADILASTGRVVKMRNRDELERTKSDWQSQLLLLNSLQ